MTRAFAVAAVAVFAVAGCAGESGARHSVIHVYNVDAAGNVIRERPSTPAPEKRGDTIIVERGPCGAMSWPVEGPVSSPFGKRAGKMHDGIDVAVAVDTPVRAACDGVVVYAGNGLSGYGNLVIVRHENALATVYAHNKELLVKEGQPVTRGQTLARSGQTGRASAPHLHFEVRKDSIARNPLGYLRATMNPQNVSARRAPVSR